MEFLGFGTFLLYLNEEIPNSALVPDPKYSGIVWDAETRGRFTVNGSYKTELNTYQYSSWVVNTSAEKYGKQIRQNRVFELSGLSEKQRDIVLTQNSYTKDSKRRSNWVRSYHATSSSTSRTTEASS